MSTVLCEAFLPPGTISFCLQSSIDLNSKTHKFGRNRWSAETNFYARNGFEDDSSGYFDDDNANLSGQNRKRRDADNPRPSGQRESDDRLWSSGNPSRRDFVAMNSIFAGLVTGVATSTPGTSAAELLFSRKKTSATPPPSFTENTPGNIENVLAMDASLHEPYSSVRKYQSLTLSNGMRVLLVNDKFARQSSAALTINGAGQFSDPTYLKGLAHLTEHIVLSSRPGSTWSNQGDFQEWLESDSVEGFSNGFTAYEKVCYHFQCGTDCFAEALGRFSSLFQYKVVRNNCFNREAVRREVRRVDSELDKNDLFSREKYLTKSLINPKHPYAKFTLGSIETLETVPVMTGVDVSQALYNFFQDKYQPDQAILVVVSPEKLSVLENMVQPFSTTMSKRKRYQTNNYLESEEDEVQNQQEVVYKQQQRVFPPFLIPGKPIRPICLFRNKVSSEILADDLEKISFQWALDQDYSDLKQTTDLFGGSKCVVTATQIGFVMAEVLGRRGQGSLFKTLQKRKWIPEGNRGLPRISFPVDVSGFQILRLEIILTLEGFSKRSSVIAAVFDYLACLRANPLSRELISQYCSVAQLYGHMLSPRAPDAIELAFDGQIYGVDGPKGVGTPGWRLMPQPDDTTGVQALQKTMQTVLTKISDPTSAITIITASQRAIVSQKPNDFEEPFPLFSPASWDISPTTSARYLSQNNVLTGKINEWSIARIMEEKLSPPVLNPLIPATIRPPRIIPSRILTNNMFSSINNNEDNPQVFASINSENNNEFEQPPIVKDYWALLQAYSHNDKLPPPGLTIPPMPPEPSSRSVFVLQFLSSRPPRATAEMAAHAEVWRISLEYALMDLAELGAPAGLAYEISYNNYGMRVAFLGLSQNLASYARRIARRMIDHNNQLLEGPEEVDPKILEASIRNANRFPMSPNRKQLIVNALKQTRIPDAAREGTAFFNSCSGAVCFSQGDLLPSESLELLADLKEIFRQSTGTDVRPSPAIPEVADLLYRANWLPRAASVCAIPGATLVSDPCGRVPR